MMNAKTRTLFASTLCVLLASAVSACASDPDGGSDDSQAAADCELAAASGGELARRSCALGKPLTADGFTPEDLLIDQSVFDIDDDAEKAGRSYAGACTGIWYGCSRVVAEGWQYTVCGSSLYAWMSFDGPYGNLTGWGTGYCWF